MMRRIFILTILLVVVAGLDAVAKDKNKVAVAPSRAWTVTEPLGLRYESTIDTLFLNYHRTAVPSLRSHAWATTGNYGAAGQDQIFFNRPMSGQFFFEDAIGTWLHNNVNHRYYNTRIPMTLLSYVTGGDKYSNQDRTTLEFSGNAGKRLQIGAGLDYIYSKGSYDQQSDKNFMWNLGGSYTGDRYEFQGYYDHYSFTTKESGGIIDDRYITHPADVQGGETRVDNKSIPTLLSASESSLDGSHVYMNHRYKVGFYRYQRDSVTDTIIGKTYVPVTSFIWTTDYKNSRHRYTNKNYDEDESFYANCYQGVGTADTTRYWHLRNTLGVSMLEGFNKYAKFGFAVYATHEIARYTQAADTVGVSDVPRKHTENRLWVGGQLTKQHGDLLRYNATAQFGVVGDAAGEIDASGDVSTRFMMMGDSVTLRAYGYFKNLAVPYLLRNYVSNHFVWHNDFSKTKRFRVGGELNLPHTGTNINVGYETLKDYVYFNNEALPQQHGDAIHVLSATLNQRLHYRALHWDNELTYQTTSDKAVLPLPAFSVYSNLYFLFDVAHVLHTQIGVDCNYYTKYYAPTYCPATMAFHTQDQIECGDFAFMNIYANFKLKKARFFVAYTHGNGKIFGGDNYFAIPHYPLNPRRFQVGVSVDFTN
ncbi:MAG: putative porin [Bacteroidales bacterium]|nr:putative porin [Candidatus Sodaliphilus aphodohippi]